MARARAVRDAAHRHPDHLLAQGVHPAHDAVPRQVRLLHLRPAAGPARVAVPHARRGARASPARGAAAGCHEALFTLGERPEERYPAAAEWLAEHGYASTVDYLVAMCRLVLDETGLLPHANAGALYADELAALRAVAPSQGMMLESLSADLDCPPRLARQDARAPPGHPRGGRRAAASRSPPASSSASARTAADRIDALEAIAASHRRHGHVQEVIVQNFLPKAGTAMHARAAVPARRLPRGHRPGPADPARPRSTCRPRRTSPTTSASLLDAGIDDWGGVSPVTADHVNPERPVAGPRPAPRGHRGRAASRLAPRLTIYPEFAARARAAGSTTALRFPVLDRSDAEGLGRDDHWYSGPTSDAAAAASCPGRAAGRRRRSAEVLGRRRCSARRSASDEIVTLFAARGPEVAAVAEVADDLRREAVGDAVTCVRNRNINYTNVCTFKCRFCGFSKGPLSLNLRGTPVPADPRRHRRPGAARRWDMGATEVCLQGGIHPDFDGDYYIDVTRAVKEAAPDIHVHGFTALEVTEGAKRLGEPLADYLPPPHGRRPAHPARHRGRDPRRRDPGASSAPTRSTPRSGSTPTAPPTRSGCAPTSRSCSASIEQPRALGPPHRAHPRPADGDRRLHRVRAAAVRAHGRADLPAAQGPPRPDVPRGAADARRRPHRLPRRSSTTSRRRG